jgi:hypothetical protein
MPTEDAQIEVIVEYDGFIAGRELAEIIEVLDEALWYEIEDHIFPPFGYRYRGRFDEPPPFFCVTEVKKGSLILTGAIGGAAAAYCFNRFKRGFRRSRFGDEIEHLGHLVGDRLGGVVERMNGWLEEYTAEAKEKKSRIKNVRVRRKPSDDKKG